MSKQPQTKSATTRAYVVTPALGPVPALYIPLRRQARPVSKRGNR